MKPTSGITLTYDGNKQASPVTVQATRRRTELDRAHSAHFALHGKQPPPPVGTIYALNLGSNDGLGATVTEYDGKAKGNAAPERTLQLSSKLYARSIAVDPKGNLYVGYFDNEFGFSPSNGTARRRQRGRDLRAGRERQRAADRRARRRTAKRSTALFPLFMSFDPSGDLVTYGATNVDGNGGNDAVLTYAVRQLRGRRRRRTAGASRRRRSATPARPGSRSTAPATSTSTARCTRRSDSQYGLFVASAADIGNPQANPARTIPWDTTTKLTPGSRRNVSLDSSGEIFIAQHARSRQRQLDGLPRARERLRRRRRRRNDRRPAAARCSSLDGVFTQNVRRATRPRDPRAAFFPAIRSTARRSSSRTISTTPIDAFAAGRERQRQTDRCRIAGSATQLNAPIALVITQFPVGLRPGRLKPF